ncbi:type IV secretory system conjugative DNA transfer family protein [Amycolatopsis sp. H20-H5]|uniref:type IV secretory system conjugative DNA transfer family protein n=1 Tax=Amycolatopsis sp. H20-H5 TaxID=3046309 RepID=UPI002DB65920|nr:type IV secretion system DNA-binding domain-containing protein [Amycolatopsis sp. H20-H5]MEC3980403.1 type IV secretion system DNA-binding domain-containing protein [Amycolatopsis sp. H20-H5]
MMAALAIVGGGLLLLWVVLAGRLLDGKNWRRSLVAMQLRLPGTTTTGDIARWLARVQVMTESPQWFLIPNTPVALEITADHGTITHTVLMPARLQRPVLASLQASLPNVRADEVPDYFATRPEFNVAAEGMLTDETRPLDVARAAETSQHVLSSLQPVAKGDRVTIQWIFSGTTRRVPSQTDTRDATPWWLDSEVLATAEAVREQRSKYKSPLLMASVRVGVQATDKAHGLRLFHRVWLTLGGMDSPGVRLLKRWYIPMSSAVNRMQTLQLPLTKYPLLLNVQEAAGLVGMAADGMRLPGMPAGIARTLPTPPSVARRGLVIGESNYVGDKRPIALLKSDRLRHLWVLGPTGSGKSTLLQNLILQDMENGDGMVVIDARGDLVHDVIDTVPEHRRDDVIIIDPSNTKNVVGFNPLALGHDQRSRELSAEHILSVLHSVYHASWGVRTADILRASLLTLVNSHAVDGSRLTLVELPELLTDDQFRNFITGQPLPPALRAFWTWYGNLSQGERATVISPVLNKLRNFTLSTPLRLTLGQSQGVDLADAFTKKKIILVPLKKGLLGAETTALVGSLVMAGVWQATLARADIPRERRRPTWLYADEFQEVMRLPLDLADMLAQSRGLGLGLILAHQHMGQLPPELKSAVLGTTRNQLVFQVEHEDARVLAPRFAPLTADDLQGLGAHEVALRPSVYGATLAPVTALTNPPPASLKSSADVMARSLNRYAVDVAVIEAGLADRINLSAKRTNKRAKGGQL